MAYKLIKKKGKVQLKMKEKKLTKGKEMKERHQYAKDMGPQHPAYSKKYLM